MKKSTKILLIIGVLGAGGYFYWKSKQNSAKSFANLKGSVLPQGCVTKPEVVQDASGKCSKACEDANGDLLILQNNVPCPQAV